MKQADGVQPVLLLRNQEFFFRAKIKPYYCRYHTIILISILTQIILFVKKNLYKTLCFSAIGLVFSLQSFAQTGGYVAYDFLRKPNSARIAALGSNFLTIYDHDLSLALANPSLITPKMANKLSFNIVDDVARINYGFVSYGFNLAKLGSFAGSMQYINYGKSDLTNEYAENEGQYNAGEYAFNLGWGRMLDSVFSIGANFKTIYSGLEAYHSFGLAVDVAGSYVPNETFCASLLFRNIGRQLSAYSSYGIEPLPFEIQAGISKKLAHVPFRYSILLQHLEKWNIGYTDPNAQVDPLTGLTTQVSGMDAFVNNAMSHIVVGGEFIPAKFLIIRLGYNYLRRKEMKIVTRPGMVGFSWGIGLKVSKFDFSYSRAAYSLTTSPNFISISTNLGDWGRK